LKELKMTKAELALKLRYSRSAVSQYLNNKYNSDPTEIESKLREFLMEYDARVMEQTGEPVQGSTIYALKSKIQYFESKDFIQTIGVCQACQENMALGIIVAKSGYGKTHTLKKYSKMPRVAYIECDDTMACRDLVEAIEIQIGMPKGAGGTIWSRVNRIRDFFNANEGYLLIIDEADKLINKYTQKKMEIIRGIFDQSDVGIVIAGEPRLEAEIKGNLARFANRMDFYYKLKGLSEQEVRDYLEGYDVEDAAMMEFISRAQNAQTGCFRLLDRTLSNVLRILKDNGETNVTMKVVNQASSMMML
ncbi:MAG: AAA family ATPase, partial [Lachnospiraceae bacterium]|nr:AAA family ATPase [Lachnospiraceae bacterium]